jgi:hypothetical protein
MPRLEGRLCGLSVAAKNGVSTTSGPNLPLSSVGDSLAHAGLPFGGVHRWLMAHRVQPVVGPEADDEHAEPQAWLKVMCLTGVDDPLRRALIFTGRYGTSIDPRTVNRNSSRVARPRACVRSLFMMHGTHVPHCSSISMCIRA